MAGMSSSDKSLLESDFELFSNIEDGLWFATKRNDYRAVKYLARRIGHFNGPRAAGEEASQTSERGLAFHDLMYVLNQAPVIAQIFNHENIVSIAGHIRPRPVVGAAAAEQLKRPEDYIVWDYCDAGNLSALFKDNPYQTAAHYLPESLCWHVLMSLARAVTYLHDGKRLFVDREAEPSLSKQWLPVDRDWSPILHRAIEPRNIFFQHPRGIETYGLCKLGNFEHAAVTNHIISPGEGSGFGEVDGSYSIALASRKDWKPWPDMRVDMGKDTESFTADDRPYTLTDEIWAIGCVIFTMMTGQQPTLYCQKYGCSHVTTCSRGGCLQAAAAEQGCNCAAGGCQHLPSWRCTHEVLALKRGRHQQCTHPDVNTDSYMARARYSWRLRELVREMLGLGPASRVRVSKVLPFTKLVEEHYRDWKQGTKEGREHRDVEDDMAARWEARKMKEMSLG